MTRTAVYTHPIYVAKFQVPEGYQFKAMFQEVRDKELAEWAMDKHYQTGVPKIEGAEWVEFTDGFEYINIVEFDDVGEAERSIWLDSAGNRIPPKQSEFLEQAKVIARLTQQVLDLEAQLSREEPSEPPDSLKCHNPICQRRYYKVSELMEILTSAPDPFYWSEELDSWMCPDCGGSDVC